jgi:hypothetical protein
MKWYDYVVCSWFSLNIWACLLVVENNEVVFQINRIDLIVLVFLWVLYEDFRKNPL